MLFVIKRVNCCGWRTLCFPLEQLHSYSRILDMLSIGCKCHHKLQRSVWLSSDNSAFIFQYISKNSVSLHVNTRWINQEFKSTACNTVGHCCASQRIFTESNSSVGLWFNPPLPSLLLRSAVTTVQLKAQQQFLFTSAGERPGTTECVWTQPHETQQEQKKEFSSTYNKQLRFISRGDLGSDWAEELKWNTKDSRWKKKKRTDEEGNMK